MMFKKEARNPGGKGEHCSKGCCESWICTLCDTIHRNPFKVHAHLVPIKILEESIRKGLLGTNLSHDIDPKARYQNSTWEYIKLLHITREKQWHSGWNSVPEVFIPYQSGWVGMLTWLLANVGPERQQVWLERCRQVGNASWSNRLRLESSSQYA